MATRKWRSPLAPRMLRPARMASAPSRRRRETSAAMTLKSLRAVRSEPKSSADDRTSGLMRFPARDTAASSWFRASRETAPPSTRFCLASAWTRRRSVFAAVAPVFESSTRSKTPERWALTTGRKRAKNRPGDLLTVLWARSMSTRAASMLRWAPPRPWSLTRLVSMLAVAASLALASIRSRRATFRSCQARTPTTAATTAAARNPRTHHQRALMGSGLERLQRPARGLVLPPVVVAVLVGVAVRLLVGDAIEDGAHERRVDLAEELDGAAQRLPRRLAGRRHEQGGVDAGREHRRVGDREDRRAVEQDDVGLGLEG